VESFARQHLQSDEINFVPTIKLDVFFRKSSPTPPTSFTGEKKLAATAAWLANRRAVADFPPSEF